MRTQTGQTHSSPNFRYVYLSIDLLRHFAFFRCFAIVWLGMSVLHWQPIHLQLASRRHEVHLSHVLQEPRAVYVPTVEALLLDVPASGAPK